MVVVQEIIDVVTYDDFGLISDTSLVDAGLLGLREGLACEPELRAFIDKDSSSASSNLARLLAKEIGSNTSLAAIEVPEFKRRWLGTQGRFNAEGLGWTDLLPKFAAERLSHLLESQIALERAPTTLTALCATLWLDPHVQRLCASLGYTNERELSRESRLVLEHAPFLAGYRYTHSGIEKRAIWEETWDLQRREDSGQQVGAALVPPKYDEKDFQDPIYFRLRGKLDVPRERFISYPGCESDDDEEALYGWAGWNHLQQAQALAALYQTRKQAGWTGARLTPMLAGLLELLPWLQQWHNEPSEEFDGLKLGDYFEGYIDEQCAELGLTRDALRAWRPEGKTRAAGRKTSTKTKATRRESTKSEN
jgi:hypothetical protein